MFTANRHRQAGSLLLGGAAAAGLLLSMLIPGFAPWEFLKGDSAEATMSIAESCEVQPFALDPADPTQPDPSKEVNGAFGPAVDARDEEGIKAELDERRECGSDGKFDPYLTAAHYSEWSYNNLTSIKVAPEEIDAFAAKLVADGDLHGKVLQELKKLEGESTFSTQSVPTGIWSLYMMPDGNGGVNVKVGRTSADGTNAVFTHGDVTVRYRLDCGFQPNRDGGFPGVVGCENGECTPPPPPPPPPAECPPGTTGTPPDCVAPKDPSEDPAPRGNAPDGGGPNDDTGPGTYIPPGDMERPPDQPRDNPKPPANEPPSNNNGNDKPRPKPTQDPQPPPPPQNEPNQEKPQPPSNPETECDASVPGVTC